MGNITLARLLKATSASSRPIPSCLGGLTLLIILRHVLIMAPPQLRPLCKLVLRTRSVHLPLQAYDLLLELDLSLGVGRRRRGKSVVEIP